MCTVCSGCAWETRRPDAGETASGRVTLSLPRLRGRAVRGEARETRTRPTAQPCPGGWGPGPPQGAKMVSCALGDAQRHGNDLTSDIRGKRDDVGRVGRAHGTIITSGDSLETRPPACAGGRGADPSSGPRRGRPGKRFSLTSRGPQATPHRIGERERAHQPGLRRTRSVGSKRISWGMRRLFFLC